MKSLLKTFMISTVVVLAACEEADEYKPVPATEPSTYTARFLFVNATPDAPSLDLYVNNNKVGTSVAVGETQPAPTVVPITSNAVIANTNIRTKATTGDIGGNLEADDLIYRAGSTNSNNFTAGNGARYTLFAVDSINRSVPLRTLNANNFGDVTYYSSQPSFTAPKKVGVGDTTIYLNVANFGVDSNPSDEYASSNSVVAFNLLRKYNANVTPSFISPIGVVPLGSTDVKGGIRYYLWQDFFATFATAADSTERAGFRVLNASPNSPGLRFRLNGATDINLNGGNAASYIMSNAGGFTPSVGSRTNTTAGANFTTAIVAPAGTPNVYDIEVATDAGFTNIVASKVGVTFGGTTNKASSYTIVVSGLYGVTTGPKALKITVVENN